MWTEEAEGGDYDRLESDDRYGSPAESGGRRVLSGRLKMPGNFACLRARFVVEGGG